MRKGDDISDLKVGTLCYATDSGLGILAKAFYDNGVITHPFVVQHAHYTSHHQEWYPGAPSGDIRRLKTEFLESLQHHCSIMDVVLFFETPFLWELLPYLRLRGVKTVLMTMYECSPTTLPYQPDYFLCPSLLDLQYYPDRSTFLPVPVDLSRLSPRVRQKASLFVHNAGHGGLRGRNGTSELIDAWRGIAGPANGTSPLLLLRSQRALPWDTRHPLISTQIGTTPYQHLYTQGDVFLFPEKFNGLSLPLQEAYASGMMVMCADRFPMNTWLAREPLIPVSHTIKDRISPRCNLFDSAVIRPEDIRSRVLEYHNQDIRDLSERGIEWGRTNSWDNLKPRYLEYLYNIMKD